jgi:glycosyltransferase involved in cell wall biosynthesis
MSVTNCDLDPALGSGKTVLAWSTGLRNLGHEVTVESPETFYPRWYGEKAKRLKMRLAPQRLYQKILSGDYDVVEFYGAEFGPLIQRLARRPRARRPLLVAHTNGLELLADEMSLPEAGQDNGGLARRLGATLIEPWIRRANLHAFSCVDGFAAICQADMDYVVRRKIQPASRCAVVEPGVDDVFLRVSWSQKKRHRLVCMGSWTPRKDPATLIAVAKAVLDANPDLEFHMLGAGGARDEVLRALPTSVHSRVTIHPRLSEEKLVEVLSEAKVFLFPSLYEGYGMATTEAMACGCAVVVTPTGFGASVNRGVDGVVCDFGDVAMMSTEINRLLEAERLREAMTSAARKRVEAQTWERQVKCLEGVYQGWLADARKAAN